jgi:Fanconi anemia group M protein
MFKDAPKDNPDFISHENIRPNTILKKQYQMDIAKQALKENTAAILPTGLGKTIVAFLVIAELLPKKILFLAPTRPLVMQHYESCRKFLNINERYIAMLSGSVSPIRRAQILKFSTIIVSTPQTIENDLKNGLYTLDQFGLVIFDEMHKAVEEYAYVGVSKNYRGLVLGLTASPGSQLAKIEQILENLKITNVESRTARDEDVREHVKKMETEWIKIPIDENLRSLQKPLEELFEERLAKLTKVGILSHKRPDFISKKDILESSFLIRKRFGRTPYSFAYYLHQSVLLHTYHCLELIETQGIEPFIKYLWKLKVKPALTRSEKSFMNDRRVKESFELAEKYIKSSCSHPKLAVLKSIIETQLKEEPDSLILLFTQYRSTISSIENTLKDIKAAKFSHFVGQAHQSDQKGMNQKEQKEIIDKFRNRELNILIATSVAEEGIDIPNVNRVIFYEPIPSEIRAIQRKGRTGRSNVGKVSILVAQGTRDEAYLYASANKERRMHGIIRNMR